MRERNTESGLGSRWEGSDTFGCLAALVAPFILAAWIYILHYLLTATKAPSGVWTCFWVYLFANVVGTFAGVIGTHLHRQEGKDKVSLFIREGSEKLDAVVAAMRRTKELYEEEVRRVKRANDQGGN